MENDFICFTADSLTTLDMAKSIYVVSCTIINNYSYCWIVWWDEIPIKWFMYRYVTNKIHNIKMTGLNKTQYGIIYFIVHSNLVVHYNRLDDIIYGASLIYIVVLLRLFTVYLFSIHLSYVYHIVPQIIIR